MAKRSVSIPTITPTATADTTALASNTYIAAIQGGSSTQKVTILEVYMGGQAAASAPTIMVLARASDQCTPNGDIRYWSSRPGTATVKWLSMPSSKAWRERNYPYSQE